MKAKAYALATLSALGLSALALAQDAPSFDNVDTNMDGAISPQEASVIEGLDFTAADKNQDGKLDRAEYEAAVH
jgi:EF hand